MRLNIALSALEADLDGARILRQYPDAAADNRTGARRTSRTATLDGGCVIYDTGYAPADRTIMVITDIVHLPWIERMGKFYSLIRVITEEGAFIGAPRQWSISNGRARLEILIKQEEL